MYNGTYTGITITMLISGGVCPTCGRCPTCGHKQNWNWNWTPVYFPAVTPYPQPQLVATC